MRVLKAHVRSGSVVLDEPEDLPEGAEVRVELLDGDELDADDRARLHAALAESEDDVLAGRVRPADDVIADLSRHQ